MPRIGAWYRLGLDQRKMLAFSLASGLAGGIGVLATTSKALPADSLLLSALVSAVVFYLASSLPARIEGSAALSQSREAPALAVMGSATLEATHSRTKAILLLRSGESAISSALEDARKRILLGHPAEAVVSQIAKLASSSVYEVIRSISSPEHPAIAETGEEAGAITRSSQLGEETKSPLFVATAFFAPLMLLLYAVMAHVADSLELGELVGLQVILLDVVFYFSSSDPRRGE